VVVSSATSWTNLTKVDIPLVRITLDAGEQIVFSPKASPKVAHVNLGQATAWENGEVVSDNDSLTTIVARINRYARNPVVVDDTETGALRISGVFHTGDVEGFVNTIVEYLPVRAEKEPDGTTRLMHR
jgi:transmembrane sensor